MTKTKQKKPRDNGTSPIGSPETLQSNTQVAPTKVIEEPEEESFRVFNAMFDRWEEVGPRNPEFLREVPVDSLESSVGYTSLFRQMHQAFIRIVAYYKS